MTTHTVPNSTTGALGTLRRRFNGGLFVPGDAGYDEHRLGWNCGIESRPAIVAAAEDSAAVRAAVLAAREHDLPLAVQATGHGSVVAADGALLLKTSSMTAVEIDPRRR